MAFKQNFGHGSGDCSLPWGGAIALSLTLVWSLLFNLGSPSWAQEEPPAETEPFIEPELLETNPLLRRWGEEIPDIEAEIRQDPAFRTRVRFGYVRFPSTDEDSGVGLGVEDVFLGEMPLTVNGMVERTWTGDRTQWGADLRYYVLPLGNSINVAPILGYRSLETDAYDADGLHLGVRLVLIPSRTGAADLSLSQSWVAPGSDSEVGITALSAGYAITPDLRLSADLHQQNSSADHDTRIGLFLEWMP
ncbi:hypothetical protein [Vacuolonema iberomarrocanum]|uniref:hypothetical protein n=1 Tax=Vacuolonema iberomarrocanum TaxID=3454632 RepID=UPI003F6DDDDC